MMANALQLTYGIEEEFFLSDPVTREAVADVPPQFLRDCRRRFGHRVAEELQRPQVETATAILRSAESAREALFELREGVGRFADAAGMRLLASGTHPLAAWPDMEHSPNPRCDRLMDDFQIVGRRSLLCGLHVHVGIPDGIDRVALMNRLMPWVPLFLAVSTSSPFWRGQRTGLLSYRQSAYDEWPRSGIPDAFADEREYTAFVNLLVRCGALGDGSFLWWALRPSSRYPTLELRISDACTRAGDALAIASAFRCLVRAHIRQPGLGLARTALTRRVIDENRWRAKRYGTQAAFVDEEAGGPVTLDVLLRRMIDLIAPDAEALRCESDIRHLAAIPGRGTSAHDQLAVYTSRRGSCTSRREAMAGVVDWIAETTAARGGASGSSTESADDGQEASCTVNA